VKTQIADLDLRAEPEGLSKADVVVCLDRDGLARRVTGKPPTKTAAFLNWQTYHEIDGYTWAELELFNLAIQALPHAELEKLL